ncbi:hypothetical protein [Kineosporia sp. A_224]|uniref:hypothetical protein n=1 Tax=Kineosporia sp. A_224 TaxID=1962180 RepID=UPI0018E93EB4|nr:hypothetical protein [Kineosporia sp. A_224]
MGYEVHITRKAFWWDEQGPEITRTEWEACVAADPELRLDGFAEATSTTGAVVRIADPGIAVWTAHPDVEVQGCWIRRQGSGNVVVNNPDELFLRKMWVIAQALGARVIGDDHETYGADGQPDGGSAEPPENAYDLDGAAVDAGSTRQESGRLSLWQRLLGRR